MPDTNALLELLSPRERQILTLRRQGLTIKQIAAQLGISISTVKTHLSRTYEKVQVINSLAAIYKIWFTR